MKLYIKDKNISESGSVAEARNIARVTEPEVEAPITASQPHVVASEEVCSVHLPLLSHHGLMDDRAQ
jgi:hypothetical protein